MRGHDTLKLLALVGCLGASTSFGFKLDTHIWIGQQIINDLEDDGRLTFQLRPGSGLPGKTITIAVPVDVKNAILTHRNEFLLGMMGPDALPDVVVGQMFPHPGVPTGWKANDWLRYVVTQGAASPPTKSFSYGYLGHASSDLWAHTYVNQYAGNVFELRDFETISEERHAALEAYIAFRQPPITNRVGAALGTPYQLVTPSDAVATFVRDQLIYAPAVQAEYARSPAGAHMVAFKAYRDGIEAAAQSSVWNKIDLAVAKYFVSEYTGYLMSDAEAQALINEVQRLNNKLNQGLDLTQDEINALNARLARIDKRFSTQVQNDSARLGSIENDFLSAKNRYESLVLEKTCEQIDLVCPRIPVPDPFDPIRPCPTWYNPFRMCGGGIIYVDDPVCRAAFQSTCRTLSTLTSLRNDALSTLVGQRSRLSNELIGLFNDLTQARADALQIANALVDLQQITTSGSPVQQLLFNWRSDTDRAFAEYTKAAAQMMINTMKGKPANVGTFSPMTQWLDCYGASLQGVPFVVSNCGNRQALQRLWATLERLSNLPANGIAISIGLPTTQEINEAMALVKANAVDALKDSVKKGLIGLIPAEHQGYITVLSTPMVDSTPLTAAYTRPGSSYDLVMIDTIVGRVDREMALTQGRFTTPYFAPVANAVTTSKLALLDATGIAALAAEGQVAPVNLAVDNLIIDSMASMDGNHQWLDEAPPRIRRNGVFVPWDWNTKGGGYPKPKGFGSAAGFPLFRPVVAPVGYLQPRDGLFLRLFVGPLNPGVEAPKEVSVTFNEFLPLVSDAYPYRTCRVAPYPKSLQPADNQSCPLSAQLWWDDPNYVEPPPPPPPCPNCNIQ